MLVGQSPDSEMAAKLYLFICLFSKQKNVSIRTVMKSGSELVKAGVRAFFENASEDLEKLQEMLKLGKFTQSRAQMKSVTQSINYVTVALLPILTALFEHVTTHDFGVDLLGEHGASWGVSCLSGTHARRSTDQS